MSDFPAQIPDFDVSLLEINLALSIDERAENHDRALELVQELKKAGRLLYGDAFPQ